MSSLPNFLNKPKWPRFAQAAQDTFWSAGNVRQGADTLAADSPFRFIAEKGLEGASKHTGMLGAVDYNTWLTMSLQRAIQNVQNRMQDGLALLATVGSTAPFVGVCLARFGASTTPWSKLACRVRPASTRLRDLWANRSS